MSNMQKFTCASIAHHIIHSLSLSFRRRLNTVSVLDTVSSTNDYLWARPHPASGRFNLCAATSQSAGRGRRGKLWHSDYGGIYLSVAWRLPAALHNTWIGLMSSVRLAERLSDYGISKIGIKWPNDLYYQGAKLGGILFEQRAGVAVLGIGLNLVTPKRVPSDNTVAWIGLDEAGLSMACYPQLFAVVAETALSVKPQARFKECRQRFSKFDLLYNQPIEILKERSCIRGIGAGVNEQGDLLVRQGSKLHPYHSGAVSVRCETSD